MNEFIDSILENEEYDERYCVWNMFYNGGSQMTVGNTARKLEY